MQRAERLLQLLTILRHRRTALTARDLAARLQVSERTVYRDMQTLSLTGVPIEGEAGVGYRMQKHAQLPPLMFDRREVEALLLGARMVHSWSDQQMASHASSAMEKILAILPEHLRHSDEDLPLLVPNFMAQNDYMAHSATIRDAIRQHYVLAMEYTRADNVTSQRHVEPLGLVFWGKIWTLLAWCQLREEYRTFRLDRIVQLQTTAFTYTTSDTKSLRHYLSQKKDHSENNDDIHCSTKKSSAL